jgi:dipeptidyl aminopeptidase/acylaminoacyl peptidase
MHHAFDNYGDISRQLAEHSPLHRVQNLPDIPYLIVHGAKDVDVSVTHHSDALVAAMKARGLRVEYHRPPLMTHSGGCDFAAHRRIADFVGEQLA